MMNTLTLVNFLAIALGAVLGAWMRWVLGLLLNPWLPTLFLGTLSANLLGGFFIGVVVGLFHLNADLSPVFKLFLITGLLGSLTTFSAFSIEVVERLISGQMLSAVLISCLHIIGSLLATYLGLVCTGAASSLSGKIS